MKKDAKGGPKKAIKVRKSDSKGPKPPKSLKDIQKLKGVDKNRKAKVNTEKPKFNKSTKKPDSHKPKDGEKKFMKDYKTTKPHYRLVEGLKVSWNVVRDRSTTTEERNRLLKQMLVQVKTHACDVALRHDASRMVQCLLQFGTDDQKEQVLQDLLPKLHEVAKTPYGHFCVLKAIAYCNGQASMKRIVSALQKHFVSLSTHVIGARTVESITQLYPPQLIRSLKGELYGKNFAILCSEPPKNLQGLIESLPKKREAILDHMRDLIIQKFITKTLLEFTYTHHMLWEYIQVITGMHNTTGSPSALSDKDKHRMEELVAQLGDSAPKLLSTKPGAKAMCLIVSHATAKDRKRIIKSLKGHCLESLLHDSAYLGIIRLVDVNDDTVNIQKSFFDELKSTKNDIQYTASGEIAQNHAEPLLRIAQHKHAHKLLLRLLVPSRRCFEPDEAVLFNMLAENSKKDAALKRKEHLLYLKDSLLQVVMRNLETLVRCKVGSKVVEAVVEAFWNAELNDAVARVYCGLPVVTGENEIDEEAEEEDAEEEEGDEDMDGDDEGNGEEEDEDADNMETDEFEGAEGEENEGKFEDDEDYQEQLEEAEQDRKSSKKDSNENEDKNQELTNIEEDSTAHVLFKRLMQWEASIQTSHEDPNVAQAKKVLSSLESNSSHTKKHEQEFEQLLQVLDKTLWASDKQCSVAKSVLGYLVDSETPTLNGDRLLLLQWLRCNRACFSLVELFNIPSMLVQGMPSTMSVLNVEEMDALTSEEGMTQGRKLLFALYEAMKDSLKAKTNKKGAGKATKKK